LGRPKAIVDRDKVRKARAAGMSLRRIAAQFGISHTLVMNPSAPNPPRAASQLASPWNTRFCRGNIDPDGTWGTLDTTADLRAVPADGFFKSLLYSRDSSVILPVSDIPRAVCKPRQDATDVPAGQ
jgi:hypothetical protein